MIRKTVFAVATVAAIGGTALIPTEASAGSGGKGGGMGGGHHGYWGGHWGRGFVALAFAVLVLGAATTASARPKNHIAEHTATTATNCYGTPVIMQGMDCPTRLVRGAEQEQEQEQATKLAQSPRLTARGSSGPYIAPLLRTPSLSLPQPSAAPYIPPPINNPSERIKQLNQSFPLNGGLGNNPTNRDAYIRYNLTR